VFRKRRISHTYPMWLWGHSLLKISPPGPPFHGTRWLPWHPHKSNTTLHPKCGAVGGVKRRGMHNRSRKVAVHGPIWASPLFIHSFNLSPPPTHTQNCNSHNAMQYQCNSTHVPLRDKRWTFVQRWNVSKIEKICASHLFVCKICKLSDEEKPSVYYLITFG
jgi:hypothetical protein